MPYHQVAELLKKIGNVPTVKAFQSELRNTESNTTIDSPLQLHLKRITGSLLSYLIALHDAKQSLVVVCETEEELQFIASDLSECGITSFKSFPAFNRRSYDKDIISDSSILIQRTELLQQVLDKELSIILCSADSLFDQIQHPEAFQAGQLL